MFNEATFREIFLPSSGNDGRSIPRNVASLNTLVHDVVNLLYQRFHLVCLALSEFVLLAQDILKSLSLLLLPITISCNKAYLELTRTSKMEIFCESS